MRGSPLVVTTAFAPARRQARAVGALCLTALIVVSAASCGPPVARQVAAGHAAASAGPTPVTPSPSSPPTPSAPVGPSHWTNPTVIVNGVNGQVNNPIVAISCPAFPVCYAIDQGGEIDASSAFNQWRQVSSVLNDGSVVNRDISCASATFCVAVGDTYDDIAVLQGSTWTSPSATLSQTLDSVSCATVSYCVAVDEGGYAYTYTGSTSAWGKTAVDPVSGDASLGALLSVSCPAVGFCVAAGADSHLYALSGTSWSEITGVTLDQPGAPGTYVEAPSTQVSCSSPKFCLALEDGGQYAVYAKGAWITHEMNTNANAVTCPGDGYCVALDGGTHALIYQHGAWSRATAAGPRIDGAIDCPTTATCAVAGNIDSDPANGVINAVTYYTPASVG
jgi:hypothetical protein